MRRDCGDFVEALRNNVVYLWNGRVCASETWGALDMNPRRGGMKRIMEEAATRHVEAIHYSPSAGIHIGEEKGTGSGTDTGFWSVILKGFFGKMLKKEEGDRMEKRVQEVTRWSDLVEEKFAFVEAAFQKYEVLVEVSIFVTVDTSLTRIGWVINQEDEGRMRLAIWFGAKVLSKRQQGYVVVRLTIDYYDRQHNSVECSVLNVLSRNVVV